MVARVGGKGEWVVSANGDSGSFWGDRNVVKLIVMVASLNTLETSELYTKRADLLA